MAKIKKQNTCKNPNKTGTLECLFRKPSDIVDGAFRCEVPSGAIQDSCGEFSWLLGEIHCALDSNFGTEDCGYAEMNGSPKYVCYRPKENISCKHAYKHRGDKEEHCRLRDYH